MFECKKALSKRLEKIKIVEARAWARKYLIAVSVLIEFSFIISKGMKLKRLISSPSHAVNQLEALMATTVPVISVDRKIN
jgi:hypothetical protein